MPSPSGRMPESDPIQIRSEMVETLKDALRCHVMQAWFPRCLDLEQGGYFCDFDREWRPAGPQVRMLEFQARQTRVAARLALAFPAEGEWAEYARHGFRYLRDVMWDEEGGGGWFWLMDREGRPAAGATKHAHSGAYAVQACALVYAATGEPSALRLAQEGLHWFERHAHDTIHGGLHSWFLRDGTVIRHADQVPTGLARRDPLSHEVGLKSTNVQGDWFEALLELRQVSADPLVIARLGELAQIYLSHISTESGAVRSLCKPDWSTRDDPVRFGFCFQAVHRMMDSAALFPGLPLAERATAILSYAVRTAHREGNGFMFQEADKGWRRFAPARFGARRRHWWVQFEALRALACFAAVPGRCQDPFGHLLERHWQFMRGQMFDDRHGGVYGILPTDLPLWDRRGVPGARGDHKGNRWKDASHETDAMVACIRLLDPSSGPTTDAVPEPPSHRS